MDIIEAVKCGATAMTIAKPLVDTFILPKLLEIAKTSNLNNKILS